MQTALSQIPLHGFTIANNRPFVLFGGMNVLESRDLAMEISETYVEICRKLDIPYVFKASFDKANRSSLYSFRGPGLEKGLQWLADIKAAYNVPVFFDVTHSLQQPGARSDSAGGRREQIVTLARAGMAVGLAGLFLEAHPDPEQAKCDGPCALRLSQLEPFLSQLKQIDNLVKGFAELDTH